MSTCNFLAPNGSKSILYAGLEQKYGEDKAVQLWNYVKQSVIAGSVDVNGEPVLSAVEDALSLVDISNNNLVPIDPASFTNHSGGADGADAAWDQIGRKHGFTAHKHYREPGQDTVDSKTLKAQGIKAIALDDETYAQGKIMADQIDKFIGENPKRAYGHYRYRNYGQVKFSDAVFAISTGMGIRPKMKGDVLMPLDRGTIYAIAGAVLSNKPAYVFDQKAGKWYHYNFATKKFEEYGRTPALTPNYAGVGSREINAAGKQAIEDVFKTTVAGQRPDQSVAAATNVKEVPRTKFTGKTLEEFNKQLQEVYDEARADTANTYVLPHLPTDVLELGGQKITGAALANLLDREDAPVNVDYTREMKGKMQNLPKRFLSGVTFEEANPLQLSEESKKRQMDQLFVQIRDTDKQPTGEYFSLDKQNQIIDSIIFRFYNIYTKLGKEASIQKVKDLIYNEFNNGRIALMEVAEGKTQRANTTPAQARQRAMDFTAIVNAFHIVGERNGLWNFAMEKLSGYGITIKSDGRLSETTPQANIDPTILDKIAMVEGGGLRDHSDSSFELDMKDTASTRMKLFLLSTVQSHFEDEVQPAAVDLFISNDQSRADIVSKLKTDIVLKTDNAARLGLVAPDRLSKNLSENEREKATQKIATINGKLFRLTTIKSLSAENLTELPYEGAGENFSERIIRQEGFQPAINDVHVKVEPYVQRKNILTADRNFLNLPQLADYEMLFQDLAGLLSNREPSYEAYLTAMKEGNANTQRVASKLEQSAEDVRKEFVSVFSAHYQRQLMILFKKSFDGHLEARVIDSNRNSEIQTVQHVWQENQKTSAILSRSAAGHTVIDRELAADLWQDLTAIYEHKGPGTYDVTEREALIKKHGPAASKKMIVERQQLNDKALVEAEQMKLNLLVKVLEVNGIQMDDRAIADLFNPKVMAGLTKGSSILNLYAGFTAEGKPMGLVDILVHRLFVATEESEIDEMGEDVHEAYKANNPLYTEGTAMHILAKAQLKYEPNIYSQTHRSAAGKTIYSFGLNTSLSHAVRQFKDSQEFRDRYNDAPFAAKSWLLEKLNASEWIRDRFQITYLDGLKNEFGSRDGVVRSDMSDREQWLTILSLFQNKENKVLAHYASLTHSDKDKTPVFMNAPRMQKVLQRVNGALLIRKGVLEAAYKNVFMAEYDRMTTPGGEDIKGYAKGKHYYYFLPLFNKDQMDRLISEGKLSKDDKLAIWKADGTPQSVENPLFKVTAFKLIRMQLQEMIEATKADWQKSALTDSGLPGSKKYYKSLMEESGLVNSAVENVGADGTSTSGRAWFDLSTDRKFETAEAREEMIHLAAADYTINAFLVNTSLAQLFYGDPALAWKGDVAKTFVDYGKRLAKDVAPGRDGEFSHSPTYLTVTAEDYKPLATELAGVPGYESAVEGSDAQEVTTVKEHLAVMYGYGKITAAQWETAQELIRESPDGYYTFEHHPDLEAIVMQPHKPVATGLRDAVGGVMNVDYIKSSSFPLYPPITAGMELDKLRRAMEDPTTGVDRMNFSTAKKLGAPASALKLYDNVTGKINEKIFESAAWLTESRQRLDRSEFRLQQEVPYDEEKDSILTVSQMNKNIVEKISTVIKPFQFQGTEMSGAALRELKETVRKKLIGLSHDAFLARIGATFSEHTQMLEFGDKTKFYDMLAEEAASGKGYTLNDIMALQSFIGTSDKLTVPLAYAPSSEKFERLMMSMVKKVVDIKMPGKSFILASPAGFKTMKTWEESELTQNDIVWTSSFNGELKTAHVVDGVVQPAQILVGFNYFAKNGARINIQDYITVVDGKHMLDTTRLPRELFQLIGARIPNQGHSSMLPIEVVGFLPQSMADMVVVPAAMTKQMGADFDVDKLFTYHRSYTATDAGVLSVDATDQKAALLNQYFDIHWSVLTHPEMFSAMMSPLDKKDAADEAALLNPEGKIPYYFSPAYQLSDFQSMKGAKVLVGMTSLASVHNSVIQNKYLTLMRNRVMGDGKVIEESAPIIVANFDGTPLELTHLSGYGQTQYNDELRTKADNIRIQQNESVDHAKNRIIDKINLDPNTAPASLAMSRLQTPDQGIPGTPEFKPGTALSLAYNARLLMQPIIREFSAEMSKANDTLSTNFTSDVRKKVFADLDAKYTKLLRDFDSAGEPTAEKTQANQAAFEKWLSKLYSPADMLENIRLPIGKEFYARQIAMLELFIKFDTVGQQLVTLQSVTAGDTRGAGEHMLSAINTEDKRGNLGKEVDGYFLSGTEDIFDNSKDSPTEVGYIYDHTIKTALELFSQDLPYFKLKPAYEFIAEQSGKLEISEEVKKTVFNAMKSYIFSSSQLGLYADPAKERMRLLYSGGDRKSVAKRVHTAKATWGKNNYFLQRLQPVIDPDGVKPDTIEYNAAKASRSDDHENSKAWLDMLVSDDADKKALGTDLIRYLYATGGLQSARNFVKFIPWASIEGSAIAAGIREQAEGSGTLYNSMDLMEQIIQHNPHLAKQLKPKMKETGNEYEVAPDNFRLPLYTPDTEKKNPAKDLLIDIKQPGGKTFRDYPTYLSYREGNRQLLYKKTVLQSGNAEGELYTRIDTLGDNKTGLLEYASSGDGVVRSIIADNRANSYVEPKPYMLSNANLDASKIPSAKMNVMKQVGLMSTTGNMKDIINSLHVIAADHQQPTHLRLIADVLSGIEEMDRQPMERYLYDNILNLSDGFKFDTQDLGPGVAAKFRASSNLMTFSSTALHNKQFMAENITHELLHYHTSIMALAIQSEEDWKAMDLNAHTISKLREAKAHIESRPVLHDKLLAIEAVRVQAFAAFKAQAIATYGQTAWDTRITKHEGVVGTIHYGLHSLSEFISHVMTNGEVMKFLNTINHKGPQTLLDHIKDLFAEFWNALVTAMGARKGSLLEEGIKTTLDLIMYQQMTGNTLRTANPRSDSALYNGMENANIVNPHIEAVDKVIGKLEEQLQDLLGSYTGVATQEQRILIRRKVDSIKEDIAELKDSRDMDLITEIGKKHLKWVVQINNKKEASAKEIMTGIRIGNMWQSISELIYGDDSDTTDEQLVKLSKDMHRVLQSLVSKSRDFITTQSDGFIRRQDFKEENLVDTGYIASRIRSLSSAANSRVIQHIAGYVETVGRHENEDVFRLMKEITTLEKEMKEHAGGNEQLQALYKKLMMPEGGWGLALQYGPAWFQWRQDSIKRRNGSLNALDKDAVDSKGNPVDEIAKNRMRKVIWKAFWDDVNKKAAFVDTTVFFDAETGKFNDNIDAAKAALAKKVGEEHMPVLLARAQERYLKYIEDKRVYYEILDEEVATGDKTAEEVQEEKNAYQNRYSPNVFFNHLNDKKTFSSSNEKYVAMAPLLSNTEMWNESYQEIMKDETLKKFYNSYTTIMDRLMSYLPKTVQEKVGKGFLPIVRQSMMSDSFNVRDYVKTYTERFTKSMTASEWEEDMGKRAFNKIAIDHINEEEADINDRSTDLAGIARVFGVMALHYKHFSAARDVIEMGETILQEVERARLGGASQMEQGGKLVTTRQGLRNALDALGYLKDYMVYRKPRALEFSTGMKLYAETTDKGKKFSLNPVRQHQISQKVRELIAKRDDITHKYVNQEGDTPMTADEYNEQVAAVDEDLSNYEGLTLYGSKIGDKLIGINQLKALSYNPFSAVANIGFGLISVAIHANGKADFTWAESRKAFKMMLNSTRKSLGNSNATAEKILNVMDRLGVVGDYVDSSYGKAPKMRDNRAAWKRYADPFAMLRSTDYFMKGVTTVAVMLNRKVTVTEAGVEKQISVWDALDKEGNWDSAKYGENKEWTSDDVNEQKQWDKLRNRVVRVNMVLHGNQDKNSPKLVNKTILGRLLGQFRMSWLPEGWYNRFQKERYDEYLERDIKGRYTTISQIGLGGTMTVLGRQLLNLIPGVKTDISSGVTMTGGKRLGDSAVDMENMRRNFGELVFFMGLTASIMMLRYLKDDDEEKDPALQLLINQLIRGKQDIAFYASPGVFDAVTRNVIPATSVITDYYKFMKASARLIVDDEYELDQWLLKMTKAGLPIPQATLINKTKYMLTKDLDALQ